MATAQVQAERETDGSKQDWPSKNQEGYFVGPRIDIDHGHVISYTTSPVLSPNAPPALEPINEPSPTTATTWTTPTSPQNSCGADRNSFRVTSVLITRMRVRPKPA